MPVNHALTVLSEDSLQDLSCSSLVVCLQSHVERLRDCKSPVVYQWPEDFVEVCKRGIARVARYTVLIRLQQKFDGRLVVLVRSLAEAEVSQDVVEAVPLGALSDALLKVVGASTDDQYGHLVIAQHARLLQRVVELLLMPVFDYVQHLSSLGSDLTCYLWTKQGTNR